VFYHPLKVLFCQSSKRPSEHTPSEGNIRHVGDLSRRKGSSRQKIHEEKEKEKEKEITEEILRKIFCNIEDILEKHRALLALIRKIFASWSPTQVIGHLFVEMVVFRTSWSPQNQTKPNQTKPNQTKPKQNKTALG